MKALITAGGRGTRLYPLTFSRNKHTIPLANRSMLERAIDKISKAGITEIGISVNEAEENVQKIIGNGDRYGVNITYIEQKGGPLGVAHVIKNAKEFIAGDEFLFYLADNIVFADLKEFVDKFYSEKLNCFLTLTEVDDPRQFGVAVMNGDKIVKIDEKPKNPKSKMAVIGVYIYDRSIMEAVDKIEQSARGEYEISDAHTYLIDNGYKIGYKKIEGWWRDAGRPDDLLDGNRILLEQEIKTDIAGQVGKVARMRGNVTLGKNSKIVGKSFIRGPVIIGDNVKIIDAYIGPYTSIGDNVYIKDAEVEHTIVMSGTKISTGERITDSIIGHNAEVTAKHKTLPKGHKLIIGDHGQVEL
ncbi:MAG: glucose-1-phosphate thymidylyltransferase [Candidatus Spechtbacterales bacterium]|nr:glucose-1-phosphate thymidylyltransferase [Candidatus Spechtbacterales bacterium]